MYNDDGRDLIERRVRIYRPDGGKTYAQFISSNSSTARPVVVMTMPYKGIDWSGEEVDTRWAGYTLDASGQHADVDGPAYDGTGSVVYQRYVLSQIIDEVRPHIINRFNVLLIYGRFYAGGSVRDDIEDMKAGMWHLAEIPDADRTRIGVFGTSWGGFEALYAGAFADTRARPLAVAAIAPPSDFTAMYNHIVTRTGDARTFLEPYRRRILAASGGIPGLGSFTGMRHIDLTALPADTLVMHDELDNLVPVTQTKDFMTSVSRNAYYWYRSAAPDTAAYTHGPMLEEPVVSSAYLIGCTYLHRRLAPPDLPVIMELYSKPAFDSNLTALRAAKSASRDVSFALPRLKEFCDSRLYLYNIAIDPPELCTGADALARSVNAVWGSNYTSTNIEAGITSLLTQ